MRKTLALATVMVLLLAASISLLAQTTQPTSALDFSLIFRPPSDPRSVKAVVGHFRWQNLRGRTETTNMDMLGDVSLDSSDIASRGKPVTFVYADSSDLAARYGRTMKSWLITVTDTTRADSLADYGTVGLTIVDVQNGSHKDTTLFVSSAGLYCSGLVTADIDLGLAPYDSIRAGDRTLLVWQTQTWQ
jgi:hypothetical protein